MHDRGGSTRANVRRANIECANIERANSERANSERANSERANIECANIERANIERTNIERTNIEPANIERANIERANIERANIERTNIEPANIECASTIRARTSTRLGDEGGLCAGGPEYSSTNDCGRSPASCNRAPRRCIHSKILSFPSRRRDGTGCCSSPSVPNAPSARPSPVPASTAGPVVMVAQAKPGTQQKPPEPAVKVTLVNYTPMSGTPGGKDYKIATLTFRFETSEPVPVTEASFYVDSVPFLEGRTRKPPITLLIHTGIFLGPPGTKVDPDHPMERAIWLKAQENLFPNWKLAYDQTENATFRWTIGGQPVGGSVVRPLREPWSTPSASPEVRRAVPAKPK